MRVHCIYHPLREEAVDALAKLRPYSCLKLDDKCSGLSFVVVVYVAGEGLEQHPPLGWIFSGGVEVSRRGLREEAVDALAKLRPYSCLKLDD